MNAEAWAAHNAKRWTRHDAARFARPQIESRQTREVRARGNGRLDDVAADALRALRDGNRLLKGYLAELLLADRLRRLQRKDWEDQPRAPAGQPDGGQWVEGGGSAEIGVSADASTSAVVDAIFSDASDWSFTEHDFGATVTREGGGETPAKPSDWSDENTPEVIQVADKPPGIGHNQPPERVDYPTRGAFVTATAQFLSRFGSPGAAAAAFIGLADSAFTAQENAQLESFKDPPKSLEELQNGIGKNGIGYQNHHIVERTPAHADGFAPARINSKENLASIPSLKHKEITRWYQTPNKDYGGLSPRDYLRGKSWDERMQLGRETMIKFGVLKP